MQHIQLFLHAAGQRKHDEMYWVGNGSLPESALLPSALSSCFDVADISVLINVKMDSTVQDYEQENTFSGEKKGRNRMERKTYFQIDLFFIFFIFLQWILEA